MVKSGAPGVTVLQNDAAYVQTLTPSAVDAVFYAVDFG